MEAAAPCVWSVARSAAIGAALGSAFHLIAGGGLKLAGRKTLTWPAIGRQSGVAAAQVGGALTVFSAVRCSVEAATGGATALSSLLAGALAVAAVNLSVPSRRAWHVKYYTTVLGSKQPVGLPVIFGFSALSGAVTLGGCDIALQRLLGVRL